MIAYLYGDTSVLGQTAEVCLCPNRAKSTEIESTLAGTMAPSLTEQKLPGTPNTRVYDQMIQRWLRKAPLKGTYLLVRLFQGRPQHQFRSNDRSHAAQDGNGAVASPIVEKVCTVKATCPAPNRRMRDCGGP